MTKCGSWTPKGPCQLIAGHGFAHDGIYGAADRAAAAADRMEREIAEWYAKHMNSRCANCGERIHTFNGGKKWTHIATAKRGCRGLKATPVPEEEVADVR